MLAYNIFTMVSYIILASNNPLSRAEWLIPVCMALLVLIFSGVTIFQGLTTIGVQLGPGQQYSVVAVAVILTFMIGRRCVCKDLKKAKSSSQEEQLQVVEAKFGILSVMTAASMAYAHGSNDVANAIGPVAAVAQVVYEGALSQGATIPAWVIGLGASGIVLGLVMYGYKIMQTVGTGITQLTPSRGFCAQFSTSVIIVVASGLGYPVSTTQTMVGAILGVGLARGMAALNMKVIKNIFVSWVITLPIGAIFSGIYFLLLWNILT